MSKEVNRAMRSALLTVLEFQQSKVKYTLFCASCCSRLSLGARNAVQVSKQIGSDDIYSPSACTMPLTNIKMVTCHQDVRLSNLRGLSPRASPHDAESVELENAEGKRPPMQELRESSNAEYTDADDNSQQENLPKVIKVIKTCRPAECLVQVPHIYRTWLPDSTPVS